MISKQKQKKEISAHQAVGTSFVVSIFDVLLNGFAVFFTGSVVTLAESLHGFADLVVAGLLFIGIKRSSKPPDRSHPFGHGRELYIWTLFSVLLMLTLTAGLTFYFGFKKFINPEPIDNLPFAYAVLIFITISNSYSFFVSMRRIKKKIRAGFWDQFKRSALIETKTTFILDLMGALAAFLGLLALVVFGITGDFRFDGIGAMMIGVTIAILAFILLRSVSDLLVGRSVSPDIEAEIRYAAMAIGGVKDVLDLRTVIIGPGRVLVNIEIHVQDKLTTDEIERLIDEVKKNIKKEVQSADHIQVELETPDDEIKKH